ncbi:hypothetical protein KVV02_002897 [Mortierella alpina]|uniref:RING-type domain-containing protein n=1 Tax=Mortierella alpina TaxID=64518 RepID=A0A9P8AC13_MORAP|nr:hypothetical protein KVV02_002897 [Mortierella alpina]
MGTVSSSLSSGADWVRTQGSALSPRQQPAPQGQSRRRRRRTQQSRNGDRSRRGPQRTRSRTAAAAYDVESHGQDRYQGDEDDFDSLDDDTDEDLDRRHDEGEEDGDDDGDEDDDDSLLDGGEGVSAGGGTFSSNGGLGVDMGAGTGVGGGHHSGLSPSAADRAQDQLYRNSNLYNLISGLNVNPLLTEVQRAGTLDLSVLEQELDDVEGGWVDIEDEDEDDNRDRAKEDDDTDVDYGHEGIVREMQPTNRSPTALACNINLKKSTLRLAKNFTLSNDPSIPPPSHLRPNYRLDFCFDSLTPCDVKLFWVVKEMEEDGDLGFRLRRLHHLPQPTAYHFPAGMNQRFISPILPLYTMSLPELTMQGLPSTSMRTFQKRNQKQWQQLHQPPMDYSNIVDEDEPEEGDHHNNNDGEVGDGARHGRKLRFGKKNSSKKSSYKDGKKYPIAGGSYPSLNDADDAYKAIMEDQYYPLVILIEATKEYNATGMLCFVFCFRFVSLLYFVNRTKKNSPARPPFILTNYLTGSTFLGPVRSLPTPEVDSPGLYLVNNQAISTFACFNISSEGGFEIKVMKQKVWINSTNYLIQEIYGFTDSVAPPSKLPKAPERTSNLKNIDKAQGSVSLATQQQQQQDRGPDSVSGTSKASPTLSRSMSRLSRAESIASRVNELTMDRPKKRKNSRKNLESKSPVLSRSRPVSSGGVVAGLEVADSEGRGGVTDGQQRRFSMVSTSSRAASGENNHGRMSGESLKSAALSVAAPGGTLGALEAGSNGEAYGATAVEEEKYGGPVETLVEADADADVDADAGAETEEEQEPNLVLLDAPECVICLSDVKDTIVLPCRHFCICSECGDVLRRRAPQRCPICRQVFQALLHIASTPTQKPEFAMVPTPASTVASNTAERTRL